ncbi:MAG: AAA family ATPase, partial [Actinomycetota bacterium]|nr:AAA family ATPase [Actinomycetota bacterium]
MALALEIVGRDEELAAIDRFLASDDPTALVVEGEAGIGKTTIWQAGTTRAREYEYLVLATRPAEAETQLSFAALGDLFGDVRDDVLSELPAPQQRALEVALLLADASGRAPDQRAVSFAFLSALRALARATPVLVAVDDVQWLDLPSAAVLAFTVRRLRAERIAFLLARRLAPGSDEPPPLERAIPPERLDRLTLGPLTLGALHHLLHGNLGTAFARPRLRRVHELSGGNPFFALELGRALARGAVALEPGQPLPVSLDALVRDRLASLP